MASLLDSKHQQPTPIMSPSCIKHQPQLLHKVVSHTSGNMLSETCLMCFRSHSPLPASVLLSPPGGQPIRASEHHRDDKGSDFASRLVVWLVNKGSVTESYCRQKNSRYFELRPHTHAHTHTRIGHEKTGVSGVTWCAPFASVVRVLGIEILPWIRGRTELHQKHFQLLAFCNFPLQKRVSRAEVGGIQPVSAQGCKYVLQVKTECVYTHAGTDAVW